MLCLFIIFSHITGHIRKSRFFFQKNQQFSILLTYLQVKKVHAFASLYLSKYKLHITFYGRTASDFGIATGNCELESPNSEHDPADEVRKKNILH